MTIETKFQPTHLDERDSKVTAMREAILGRLANDSPLGGNGIRDIVRHTRGSLDDFDTAVLQLGAAGEVRHGIGGLVTAEPYDE